MTIRQFRAASFATLFLVLASGCGEQEEGDRCETNADCASGLRCVDVNDVDLCCPQTGATVDAPLMTQIARKFNIDVSILSSDLDYAGGVKFGMMVAELFGNEQDDNAAIEFLREHNVKVEVLGYVL